MNSSPSSAMPPAAPSQNEPIPNTPIQDPRYAVRALLDAQTAKGRHQSRTRKDFFARYAIGIGGSAVIGAVVLIFFYLLSVVLPVFHSAELNELTSANVTLAKDLVYTQTDEYGELITSISADGSVRVQQLNDGAELLQQALPLPTGVRISSATTLDRASGRVVVGLSNGRALVLALSYALSYDQSGARQITPSFSLPYGETLLALGAEGEALVRIAAAADDDSMVLVAQTGAQALRFAPFTLDENMMEETVELVPGDVQTLNAEFAVDYLLLEPSARWLYAANSAGRINSYALSDSAAVYKESVHLTEGSVQLSELKFLLGGISLLAGDSSGAIVQWMRVRDEHNEFHLQAARRFDLGDSAITQIVAEPRRKGFVASSKAGELGVFYTTSERRLLAEQLPATPAHLELNARSNRLLTISGDGAVSRYQLDNEHPEVSWSALWHEVWYESYPEPDYVWQSSSASDDFEPKFSLVPLAFGTLKAALYAMLFALPIGICGAMYTAYFMSPQMRGIVKPMVEIMAALPSVILGFVAGLWLAPTLEENLPGFFAMVLGLPVLLVGFGWCWRQAPVNVRRFLPEGWQPALLIPVIVLFAWACFAGSASMESALFGGNARDFITEHMGLGFDQRNSLIVGIAMGFAVIPTVFTIAEDAVFGVPKMLINGSLALGASPWQTMVRVILPTASPGIFSAVMIGLGRAVGETMIVLMATGNTPIMTANIFEGLRSLSANIAVEMPEAELGSSHYRVLFLAALVLFLFTFIFNTIAEIVRARLRKQYGSL